MDNEIYPLDDAAVGFIAEKLREIEALKQDVQLLEAALNGALTYFARLHKLEGQWKLADNRRELVREASPVETTT